MKRDHFLLFISIIEIIRWIIIYFFLNFVKSNLPQEATIQNEAILWFGSVFFVNIIFAISGIFCFIDFKKYSIVLNFWLAYKIIFVFFILFLLFSNILSLFIYIFIASPLDLLFAFYIILIKVNSKNIQIKDNKN